MKDFDIFKKGIAVFISGKKKIRALYFKILLLSFKLHIGRVYIFIV